jgi:hypothetical protein
VTPAERRLDQLVEQPTVVLGSARFEMRERQLVGGVVGENVARRGRVALGARVDGG